MPIDVGRKKSITSNLHQNMYLIKYLVKQIQQSKDWLYTRFH